MKVIMSYLIGEQKQHLLWSAYDDEEAELNRYKIHEFNVCDCFIDWIIHFRNEKRNIVFSEEDITDFFDEIPTEKADCDIFCLFGKVTTVCCRNAVNTSSPCFINLPDKKIKFHCSTCQINYCKNVHARFIRLKND